MATVACFKSREHLLILVPQQSVFILQSLNSVFVAGTQRSALERSYFATAGSTVPGLTVNPQVIPSESDNLTFF